MSDDVKNINKSITIGNDSVSQMLSPVNLLNRDIVQAQIQSEYDRHYQNYRRGCRGCIVGVWAVRDVARKIGIQIKELI